MARVNYSDIAKRYDQNPIRRNIAPDTTLNLASGKPWNVLDLGCGTGSYIEIQSGLQEHKNIRWYGADPSEDMLNVAREKAQIALFHKAGAEDLPFDDNFFDYVTSRFSFHHFADRNRALKEIFRVLKPGGYFKIVNLAPELSPNWWIFRYFPASIKIDQQRFWDLEFLKSKTIEVGFELRTTQLQLREKIESSLILNEARNRETSELLLIDDGEYRAGLRRLEEELAGHRHELVDWGLMVAELEFIKA
jgi:ubiquinone/menaquinone biosynthesis C-methylase UbiE